MGQAPDVLHCHDEVARGLEQLHGLVVGDAQEAPSVHLQDLVSHLWDQHGLSLARPWSFPAGNNTLLCQQGGAAQANPAPEEGRSHWREQGKCCWMEPSPSGWHQGGPVEPGGAVQDPNSDWSAQPPPSTRPTPKDIKASSPSPAAAMEPSVEAPNLRSLHAAGRV